jgi:hypothetical protein
MMYYTVSVSKDVDPMTEAGKAIALSQLPARAYHCVDFKIVSVRDIMDSNYQSVIIAGYNKHESERK